MSNYEHEKIGSDAAIFASAIEYATSAEEVSEERTAFYLLVQEARTLVEASRDESKSSFHSSEHINNGQLETEISDRIIMPPVSETFWERVEFSRDGWRAAGLQDVVAGIVHEFDGVNLDDPNTLKLIESQLDLQNPGLYSRGAMYPKIENILKTSLELTKRKNVVVPLEECEQGLEDPVTVANFHLRAAFEIACNATKSTAVDLAALRILTGEAVTIVQQQKYDAVRFELGAFLGIEGFSADIREVIGTEGQMNYDKFWQLVAARRNELVQRNVHNSISAIAFDNDGIDWYDSDFLLHLYRGVSLNEGEVGWKRMDRIVTSYKKSGTQELHLPQEV